jgi:polyisoprenoid-binding protein YceI
MAASDPLPRCRPRGARQGLLGWALMAVSLWIPAGSWAQAIAYTLDVTHTFVTWEVMQGGITITRGRFDKKEGSIEVDRTAKAGRIDIRIDTTSLSTGVEAFDSELKGPAFFDVAQHPQARYLAERLVFAGDKLSRVEGSLTLLGKSLPLTLNAVRFNCYLNPLFKREVCGGDFEAQLQRSAWGLGGGQARFADAIKLLVQVEAIKQ